MFGCQTHSIRLAIESSGTSKMSLGRGSGKCSQRPDFPDGMWKPVRIGKMEVCRGGFPSVGNGISKIIRLDVG